MEENLSSTVQGSPDFRVGSVVFDRYKILKYISSGANGRVFKALDIDLDNEVALKVLVSNVYTDRQLIRFQSEARVASKLRHQNIATIYDFGLSGTIPYLSMEFVEGETLQERLSDSGPLSMDETLDVLIQVCEALVHAHSIGIVHRDIKPDNIIVSSLAGGRVNAKVLDFGVAKKLDIDLSSTEGKLTRTGDLVGSPAYMSPEQSKGEDLTVKSDNYSFGCLIWVCLVGEPPIHSSTILETISRLQNEVPPSLKTILPQASDQLTDVVDRLLSKAPGERPDLGSEVLPLLVSLLENHCHREEVDTDTVVTSSHSSTRPNSSLIAGGALLTLLLVGVWCFPQLLSLLDTSTVEEKVALGSANITEAFVEPELKLPPEKGYRKDLLRLRQVNDVTILEQLDWNVKRLDISRCDVSDKCFVYLARMKNLTEIDLSNTNVSTLKNASKLAHLMSLNLNSTDISDESLINLAGLRELRVLSLSNDRNLTDDALSYIAEIPRLETLDLRATKLPFANVEPLRKMKYLKYIDLSGTRISAAGIERIASIPSVSHLAFSPERLSVKEFDRLKATYPLVSFNGQNSLITDLNAKIDSALDKRHSVLAVKYIMEKLKHYASANGARFDYVACQLDLGKCYRVSGQLEEASTVFQEAITSAEKYNYPELKLSALDGFNLTQVDKNKSNHVTASPELLASMEKANELMEKLIPPNSREMATRCLFTGDLYKEQGLYSVAHKWYQKSKELFRRLTLSPSDDRFPYFAQYYIHYGSCLSSEKRHQEALEQYRVGMDMFRAVKKVPDNLVGVIVNGYIGYANTYLCLRKPDDALRISDEAGIYFSNKRLSDDYRSLLRRNRALILDQKQRKEQSRENSESSHQVHEKMK